MRRRGHVPPKGTPPLTPFTRLRRFVLSESLFLPLAAALLCGLLIVPPWGAFPIVDDFFHARVLRESIEQGSYAKHPFISVTLVGMIAWALPFALLFGDSYDTLRVSTLVLALIGAWATARTARTLGAPRWASLLAGATLLYSPIYYTLSYSFMSDVPQIAASALATYCFVRAVQSRRSRWVVLGAVFSLAAFFVRQPAIVTLLSFWCLAAIPLAMIGLQSIRAPHFPLRGAFTPRMYAALAGSTILCVLVIAGWYRLYPNSEHQSSWLSGEGMWDSATYNQYRLWFCIVSVAYMGLFAAPVVLSRMQGVALGGERWPLLRWAGTAAAAGAIAVLAYLLSPGMTRMPYLGDYLYDLGAGNLTFSSLIGEHRNWKPFSVGPLWWPATLLAWAGGAILLADVARAIRDLAHPDDRVRTRAFAALFVAGVLAAFILNILLYLERGRFDRYLLPAVSPALVLFAMHLGANKLTKMVGAASIAGLACFTLVLQQDYFTMTDARWKATAWLLDEHGADPLEVDGGYEYNGVYTLDAYVEKTGIVLFADRGERGYWLMGDRYAIDVLPRDGYRIIHESPYFSWLGFTTRRILVMEREEG